MVAHDEFIAGERVERVGQFSRLGHGEVAGIRHAIDLSLEQRLPGGLGEKCERLGQHKAERCGEQRVVHSHGRGCRVFLDPQDRAHTGLGGRAIFDRLVAEEQPAVRQHVVQWHARQRHSLPLAVDEQPEKFQQRGTPDPAGSIASQQLRLVADQGRCQRLRQLLARIERVVQFQPRRISLRAGERPRHQTAGKPGGGSVQHAQIDFVLHQGLAADAALIARLQMIGEVPPTGAGLRCRHRGARAGDAGAAPHHLGPERDVRTRDVAP